MWTATSGRLDLAGTRSADEALARLRGPAGGRARASRSSATATGRSPGRSSPRVAALDEVAPDVPSCSSAATPTTAGSTRARWRRSASPRATACWSRPSGTPCTPGSRRSPATRPRPRPTCGWSATAAAKGVVGVVELEYGEALDAWPDRWARASTCCGSAAASTPTGSTPSIDAGLRTGDPLVEGQDLLTMGPLKIISDGSLNTRTAWCEHPYADGSGSGAPNQTPEELRALMARATEHGLRTAVHAIGDAACHDALAAYAETGARGSIEHAQLMTRDDVTRDGAPRRRRERAARPPARRPRRHRADLARPRRPLLPAALDGRRRRAAGAGLRRAGLAARPLAGDGRSRAPLRRRPPGLAPRAGAHPDARRSPPRSTARARCTPARRADLVLLDADPLDPSGTAEDQAARLRAMPVAATWVAGRLVHGDDRRSLVELDGQDAALSTSNPERQRTTCGSRDGELATS